MMHDYLYWWLGPLGAAIAVYFLWPDISRAVAPFKREKWNFKIRK